MRSLLVAAVLGIGLCGLMPHALLAAQPKALSAAILVHLPADAKLTVDDHATTSTSATREFITPPLERGRIFHYTLKAEFVRGGETIRVEKNVPVRADKETTVTLDLPGAESRGPSRPEVTQTRAYDLAPNVAPASEQDPIRYAGPPGSNSPLSLGVGQG
jgi:uncharacterized protein (TIGR03000 family)